VHLRDAVHFLAAFASRDGYAPVAGDVPVFCYAFLFASVFGVGLGEAFDELAFAAGHALVVEIAVFASG
jgi:hypothetical protein